MKSRVLSGITATGKITIGNYIGAIQNFIKLQDEHEMFIFIANLHALTTPISKKDLKENTIQMACLYVACGLDPEKCNLFVQSDISAHSELAHILLCQSTIGELKRMVQFKDKSVKHANNTESIPTGLLTYPTLMAADILLYKPALIPVGIDQKQHLELAKTLLQRFNKNYGPTFVDFDIFTPKTGAKIMSLTNPTKKMSKTDSDENSFITMLDSKELISKKIKSALTDSDNKVLFNTVDKPGISNLMVIYSSFSDLDIKNVEEKYANLGYREFKNDLIEIIWNKLSKIQDRYNSLLKNNEIFNILKSGADKARKVANNTLDEVKNKLGINYSDKGKNDK